MFWGIILEILEIDLYVIDPAAHLEPLRDPGRIGRQGLSVAGEDADDRRIGLDGVGRRVVTALRECDFAYAVGNGKQLSGNLLRIEVAVAEMVELRGESGYLTVLFGEKLRVSLLERIDVGRGFVFEVAGLVYREHRIV